MQKGSKQSAQEIVPLVMEMIAPKSVIDVGCGIGTWLSVFSEYGVDDILGVDGDFVDREMLWISRDNFLAHNLRKPLRIEKEFDLVLSVEVAEHLPAECAEDFVKLLVGLGPIVLFSAAIPFQGGTNHINEQWPDYWMRLFKHHGYVAIDALRKKIWKNDAIEWWYRQNSLIFAREEEIVKHPLLEKEYRNTNIEQLSVVIPELFLKSNRNLSHA